MYALLKTVLPYFFCASAAYLAGAVNFAWLIARQKGVDIQHKGSGNPGTTNVGRVMGLTAASMVFVGDVLKAAAMVFTARFLFSDSPGIGEVTTFACVLGHMFPFYLDFKGGKGVAVLLGASLGTDWRVFFALIAVLLLVAFLSDHLFLGNLSAIAGFWLWSFLAGKRWPELLVLFFPVAMSFWRHRGNFARLFAGQEASFRDGFKKKIQSLGQKTREP